MMTLLINSKNIAEFQFEFPFQDFFTEINHMKKNVNLSLIKSEKKKVKNEDHLISSYELYYSDLNGQVKIRVTDSSFFIDFNDFITLADAIDKEEFRKLENRDIKGIRIIITARNADEMYCAYIENIKRYYLIEDISKLSKYELKKIADGKRSLKYTEITL